jgi:hypothetical protein
VPHAASSIRIEHRPIIAASAGPRTRRPGRVSTLFRPDAIRF